MRREACRTRCAIRIQLCLCRLDGIQCQTRCSGKSQDDCFTIGECRGDVVSNHPLAHGNRVGSSIFEIADPNRVVDVKGSDIGRGHRTNPNRLWAGADAVVVVAGLISGKSGITWAQEHFDARVVVERQVRRTSNGVVRVELVLIPFLPKRLLFEVRQQHDVRTEARTSP